MFVKQPSATTAMLKLDVQQPQRPSVPVRERGFAVELRATATQAQQFEEVRTPRRLVSVPVACSVGADTGAKARLGMPPARIAIFPRCYRVHTSVPPPARRGFLPPSEYFVLCLCWRWHPAVCECRGLLREFWAAAFRGGLTNTLTRSRCSRIQRAAVGTSATPLVCPN